MVVSLCSYSFLGRYFSFGNGGGAGVVITGGKAKLVHHPIGFGAFSCTSAIVNKCFLESNAVTAFSSEGIYRLVNASCFPKSRPCHPIRSYAIPILSSSFAKEVSFIISHTAWLYINIYQRNERNICSKMNEKMACNNKWFIQHRLPAIFFSRKKN